MLVLLEKTCYSSELNFELQIFQDSSGQYWFHAATICDALSLKNPTQVLKRSVDGDWCEKFPVIHGKEAWFVKEPGLYQLAFVSKTPSAKKFQRWVLEEVLPKLRADGYYIARTDSETLTKLQSEIDGLKKKLHKVEWELGDAYCELGDANQRLAEWKADKRIEESYRELQGEWVME